MQNRFGATVLVWSLASFAVTAACFLPGKLQATNPTNIRQRIAEPKSISTDRLDLSLKLKDQPDDKADSFPIEPGTTPDFKLEAVNKTNGSLTVPVSISMTAM